MKERRLQKFILSFGIILSLLTSALAACACSHHASGGAKEHAESCHQANQKIVETEISESDTQNSLPAVSENCICLAKTFQPFVAGKSENIKTQKTLAILPIQIKAENSQSVLENEPAKVHFTHHFYNSNYLEKLTSPRAPPVL